MLSSEEEYDIAKRIEDGERKIRNLLFEQPHAVSELHDLAVQIKKDAVNIIDVVKNIDELNFTKADEEQFKKKTVTLVNTAKEQVRKTTGTKTPDQEGR